MAAQCKTEMLGRDIIATIPLALEFRSFNRDHFSQALHRHCDKSICSLHRPSRLVNKTHLDGIPSGAKILRFFGRKEGRAICSSRVGAVAAPTDEAPPRLKPEAATASAPG